MIGLETYLDHLGPSGKASFDSLMKFQVWMHGRGFHHDVGGTHPGSPIVRKLERHVRSRTGKHDIIAIGGWYGDPPQIVELHAVVSCITEQGSKRHYKPIFGILWLSNHIIAARHTRLVMNLRSARQYRRDEARGPQLEAEVKAMLDEL